MSANGKESAFVLGLESEIQEDDGKKWQAAWIGFMQGGFVRSRETSVLTARCPLECEGWRDGIIAEHDNRMGLPCCYDARWVRCHTWS